MGISPPRGEILDIGILILGFALIIKPTGRGYFIPKMAAWTKPSSHQSFFQYLLPVCRAGLNTYQKNGCKYKCILDGILSLILFFLIFIKEQLSHQLWQLASQILLKELASWYPLSCLVLLDR